MHNNHPEASDGLLACLTGPHSHMLPVNMAPSFITSGGAGCTTEEAGMRNGSKGRDFSLSAEATQEEDDSEGKVGQRNQPEPVADMNSYASASRVLFDVCGTVPFSCLSAKYSG